MDRIACAVVKYPKSSSFSLIPFARIPVAPSTRAREQFEKSRRFVCVPITLVHSSTVDQASGGSEPAEKIALGESDYMSSRSKGFSPIPLGFDFLGNDALWEGLVPLQICRLRMTIKGICYAPHDASVVFFRCRVRFSNVRMFGTARNFCPGEQPCGSCTQFHAATHVCDTADDPLWKPTRKRGFPLSFGPSDGRGSLPSKPLGKLPSRTSRTTEPSLSSS